VERADVAVVGAGPAGLAAAIVLAEHDADVVLVDEEAIDEGLDVDLDGGLRIERKLFAGLFATEDRSIGMTSFVENGPGKAEFVGR